MSEKTPPATPTAPAGAEPDKTDIPGELKEKIEDMKRDNTRIEELEAKISAMETEKSKNERKTLVKIMADNDFDVKDLEKYSNEQLQAVVETMPKKGRRAELRIDDDAKPVAKRSIKNYKMNWATGQMEYKE